MFSFGGRDRGVIETVVERRVNQGSVVVSANQGPIEKLTTGIGSGSWRYIGIDSAAALSTLLLAGFLPLFLAATPAPVQKSIVAPLPPISQLVYEVREHQYRCGKVRENYTYTSLQTIQDLDDSGQVMKAETIESQNFFVNGHVIERTVKKNGRALDDHDQQKEAGRVTRLVEKAHRTPPGLPLEGLNTNISRVPEIISRVLDIMELSNLRRETWHDRPAIVFDFVGRSDAKTHGLAEDISTELQGTIWIDEADRQFAHLEVKFTDDFRLAGGLVASVEKGSSFHLDQAPVNGELWLPSGGEGAVQARLLMVKALHRHYLEQDYGYSRLNVETSQIQSAKVKQRNTR